MINLNDMLLDKDNHRFWKVFRNKFGGGRTPQSPTVNGISEESDIAGYFAKHFLRSASPIQTKLICIISLLIFV